MNKSSESPGEKPEAVDRHRCATRVYAGSFSGHPCSKPGKVERGGKWYCGTHDPVRLHEKRAARAAKWDAEWAAKDAARDASKAEQAALERDAARWRWLRANAVGIGGLTVCVDDEMEAAIDSAIAASET